MTSHRTLSVFLISSAFLQCCKAPAIPREAYESAAGVVLLVDALCEQQGRSDCAELYEASRAALHSAAYVHDVSPGSVAERCAYAHAGRTILQSAGRVGAHLPDFEQSVIALGEVCSAAVAPGDIGHPAGSPRARPTEL